MTYDIDEGQEESLGEIVSDTQLPKDLIEHLQSRNQQRKEVIDTTEKLSRFFVGWALNSTGFFIAKFLLLTGGSVNYWLAITLCFSVCSVGSFAGLTGFRVNYNRDGLEVDNMQNIFKSAAGLATAGTVTWLATKDYQYFEALTRETATQINQDIQTIEQKHPSLDPWLSIGIAALLVLGALGIIFKGGRD
ncbi:hypothetical protein PI95_031030 [Hassallia byssoidea VB512170]|uniref:Uncharacterized protein n=1 Tax=Hassallia byssoidea VB512170 TaxID=1304833 RepID=A0A846HJG7_9CYAN|nr:hypothetical protein [Hassalia byssoidea]NEU76824.1 hypothetical protein [Hassalia byssoidea VB512170]